MTSTWKASLSTWLKSGLTVASSVTVGRQSPLRAQAEVAVGVGRPQRAGAARSWLRVSTCRRNQLARRPRLEDRRSRASRAVWKTHLPGSSAGHDTDTPMRLTRRQNRMPICTSAPPLKRIVCERQADLDVVALVVDAAGALPDPVRRGVLVPRQRVDHVELNAARVDHQVVGRLAGAERVEAQADPVVAPDVVAAGDRCLDAGRLGVVAAEGEVERVLVVGRPRPWSAAARCRRAAGCTTSTRPVGSGAADHASSSRLPSMTGGWLRYVARSPP